MLIWLYRFIIILSLFLFNSNFLYSNILFIITRLFYLAYPFLFQNRRQISHAFFIEIFYVTPLCRFYCYGQKSCLASVFKPGQIFWIWFFLNKAFSFFPDIISKSKLFRSFKIWLKIRRVNISAGVKFHHWLKMLSCHRLFQYLLSGKTTPRSHSGKYLKISHFPQ